MFGVSAVLIVLVAGIGISWWHGRYKLGQILFGLILGLLLASIAPSLPTTAHGTVVSVFNAISSINWNSN